VGRIRPPEKCIWRTHLYAAVMSVEIRQLRCLLAIADEGTFTDAAIELGVSQAAVSRTLAALESELGVRLVRRTTRAVSLTATGARVAADARRLMAELDNLVQEARSGRHRVRLGYAWSAVGRHTVAFQREWHAQHSGVELVFVRTNSPTAGLADGVCDLALLRSEPDARRFDWAIVGTERRYCVMAADDPWAKRRFVRLADLATRPLAADRRTGTTTLDLWPPDARPGVVIDTVDIDDWLTLISAGEAVGMTPEATVWQYPRPGVVYRLVRDAPSVPVHLAWWRDEKPDVTDNIVGLLSRLYRLD